MMRYIIVKKKNKQKSKKITFEIRFLDTYAFMPCSIENLTNDLKNNCSDIDEFRKRFLNISNHYKNDEKSTLILQKGIYPYNFTDSYEKLNINYLPSKSEFYNKLYNNECNHLDYKQAQLVWSKFN